MGCDSHQQQAKRIASSCTSSQQTAVCTAAQTKHAPLNVRLPTAVVRYTHGSRGLVSRPNSSICYAAANLTSAICLSIVDAHAWQLGEGGYAFVYLAKELPTAERPYAADDAVAIKKVGQQPCKRCGSGALIIVLQCPVNNTVCRDASWCSCDMQSMCLDSVTPLVTSSYGKYDVASSSSGVHAANPLRVIRFRHRCHRFACTT